MTTTGRNSVYFSVAVAALGYFVDLYDIVIFGVVRVASLNELGITGAENTAWGIKLLNLQMIGMLVGGLSWGVIGDKLGRRFALLSCIALYSLANVLSGLVVNVEQYAVMRLIAGFGLAGELGAGITLVSELLPKNRRGYGTTVISFLGLVGALFASWVGGEFHWRSAYIVGGLMGFAVLISRWFGLRESDMFKQHKGGATQGDLRLLLKAPALLRFLAVVCVGVPIWYVSALYVTFAPEYGKALGFAEPLRVADVLRWQAIGLAIGSGFSGLASEWLQTRKRVIYACLAALMAGLALLLTLDSAQPYLYLMFFIGLAQGYWTAFITMSAEQFGTNIRATVSTSVPNFVRAMTVPMTLSVQLMSPTMGWVGASTVVGVVVFAMAFVALYSLKETWGRDLNYLEK